MAEWRFDLVPAPEAGTKRTGFVDWSDPLLRGWEWPYIAVHGAAPGPALLITAGVHAAEYPAIDTAIRVAAALDPARVRGQVLVLPVVNVPSFWGRTAFVCPLDGLNPNRVFPGKATGTFSERLAFHLTQRAIARADAFIDLHGGDVVEALDPFAAIYTGYGHELDARARALADAFGLPNLITLRQEPGAPIRGTTTATAASLGVVALLAEAGGCGLNEPEANELLERGLWRALRQLGVLDTAPGGGAAAGAAASPGPARVFTTWSWPRTEHAGFFRPAVKVGDRVQAGATLGTLVDFFNQTVETVRSPITGRILFLTVSPAMTRDGLVAGIGAED